MDNKDLTYKQDIAILKRTADKFLKMIAHLLNNIIGLRR